MYDSVTAQYLKELNEAKDHLHALSREMSRVADLVERETQRRDKEIASLQGSLANANDALSEGLRALHGRDKEIAELKSFQANFEHATKLEREEHEEELSKLLDEMRDRVKSGLASGSTEEVKMGECVGYWYCRLKEFKKL